MSNDCTFRRIDDERIEAVCCPGKIRRFKGDPATYHSICASALPPQPPTKARRFANFTFAAIKHATKLFPTCNKAERESRFAICQSCKLFHKELFICTHERCGCPITAKEKWFSKVGWRDQECPIGRWKVADREQINKHRELLEIAVTRRLEHPRWDADRGIVIGAGGRMYFSMAWAVAAVLRESGCRLPIQFWYLGEGEMDPWMLAAAKAHDIECVDARVVAGSLIYPPRILNGFELKAFSVLHTRFREVLYLDADCVPTRDPSFLFDHEGYRGLGSIFWPDYTVPYFRMEWVPDGVWRNAGMQPRPDDTDFESGQFLVNREKCWRELNVAWHFNNYSDYWYNYVFGDKTTYHLAWRKCGTEYVLPPAPGGLDKCIVQHDFDGVPLFQHVTLGKKELANGLPLAGIVKSDVCQAAVRSLANILPQGIWPWQPSVEAAKIPGRYLYRRIGLEERPMVLHDGGQILAGQSRCEKRWSIYTLAGESTLVIVGEAHKGSEIGMMLLHWRDGAWRGRWEAFEQCEVELLPVK